MKLLLTLLSFFLVALAPTPTHAQLARREFSTQPAFLFSFDTDPATTINTATGRPQSLNSTFEYTLGAGDHTGLLSLDGTNDFINLRTFFDDNQRVLADATLGGDMSFEVWVTWTQLRQNGRVVDFGGPAAYNDNNIFLSTQGTQSNIMFGMKRNATNSAYTYANSGITLHEWVHIVCTIRQINFTNEADPNAALHSIYLNGVLVTNRTSYLPWVTQRPISWLGRSNWEWNGDSRFRGLIDDFLVYNYSLGAEAVNAHYTVPRVPVFELVFDVDPRVNMNTQSSATYNWVASDAADTSLNQVAHPGLLLLTAAQQQYVTASVLSGTSSVGTQLPTVGGNGWIAADVDTKGWTFEVAIKFTALNANARIFDMGNPSSTAGAAAIDRITLGLSSTGTQLVFEITDSVNGAGGPGASLTVLSSVDVNRWYHIIVVVQPTSSTSSSVARYFAYVDGALTNSLASGVWPRATSRSLAYIGRSTRSTDSYTSALIDSIRVYDYVLEQSEVLALYTSVSKISTVTPAMQSQYRTDPVTSHTFDVSPPWSERNDGTSIGWSSLVAGRAGCLTLNGVNQWVNLYSLPDRNGRRFPSFIGGSSLSLEFWVRFNEFESGSRVFEFTNGDPSGTSDMRDRLVVSNAGASSNMSFVMSAGTTETMRVNVPNVFRELVWTHVVVSFRAQQPYNLTALSDVSIYVNAQLVVSGVARLPPYVSRANNWLGRSRFSNDGYMNGSFDAFHYYNYALESEQVVAHYVLPRPPLFELTFSSNPRVFGANATTLSWSWAAFDQADSAHDRTLHPGVLMLSAAQSQFVDLATGVGSSSVGTVLPYLGQLPTLTDVNRTAAFVGDARARVGMSLEVSFKYDAQASGAFAKVFSCSAANGGDAISLGFTASSTSGSSSNVLALNVSNAEAGRFASQTIVAAMATNTWYHIAVVMSPEALSGSGTDFFATWMIYVNGQLVNTVQRQVFPASNRRPVCYLGRDAQATSGAYLTGAIDVFRVYDYALTTSDVNGVYAAISAYGVVVPSSTGAGGGVVPTAVPRTSSSVAVAGVVASSSAFVVTPAVSSSAAGGLQPAADASSGDSLTSGSIAGIVIGAIVGVVLLVVMVMLLLRRASHNKKAHSGNMDGHGAGAGAHVELSEVNVQDEHESTNDEL